MLKTLEEPPRGARLLLSASQPAHLLPTVRSRCQVIQPAAAAGCDGPAVVGRSRPGRTRSAAGGLFTAAAGGRGSGWCRVSTRSAGQRCLAPCWQGQGQAVSGWPAARVLDALQKLCHDGLALSMGGGAEVLSGTAVLRQPASAPHAGRLGSRTLVRQARQIDHPWNEGLLVDALLLQAQAAWRGVAEPSDTLAA